MRTKSYSNKLEESSQLDHCTMYNVISMVALHLRSCGSHRCVEHRKKRSLC